MGNIRNNKLSMEELDKQEQLTPERLLKLTSQIQANENHGMFSFTPTPQPKSGIHQLINWADGNFSSSYLKEPQNGSQNVPLINNRIVVDGQFMHFCEIYKINLECVHRDALITWKSESGAEKFVAQGVFKITAKGFSFLHAALFNSGAQSEEEVFHFIIVNERDLFKYVKLRNDFDTWLKMREGLQDKSIGSGSGKKIAGLDRYTAKIKK